MMGQRIAATTGAAGNQKLSEPARFLNEELTVIECIGISDFLDNPVMVNGLFPLKITFGNGVEHKIFARDYFGGTGSLSLYHDDLKKMGSYELSEGAAEKFRVLIESFSWQKRKNAPLEEVSSRSTGFDAQRYNFLCSLELILVKRQKNL